MYQMITFAYMEEKEIISATVQGGFAAVVSTFVMESLQHMIPWLIVTFFVIVADLAFGVRKSLLIGERVRFSRAVRCTLGKMVTYFAFVVMVCTINVATGKDWNIDVYACLLVCLIEISSIFGNILEPKGLSIDLFGAMYVFFKKVADMDKEDVKCIVKEEGKSKRKRKRRSAETMSTDLGDCDADGD